MSENSSQRSKFWKKGTLGRTEGVLSNCTKAESFRTIWYVLLKTRTCRIITEVFQFYATCFILPFLLKNVLQSSLRTTACMKLHPKLIFWSALKKIFMVPEDRSYVIQYFAKIFRSSLVSMLHIQFSSSLKKSTENVLWIANSSQNCNL